MQLGFRRVDAVGVDSRRMIVTVRSDAIAHDREPVRGEVRLDQQDVALFSELTVRKPPLV